MRALVLVFLLAGCLRPQVVRLGTGTPLPAVRPESVSVFREPPARPYTEVALLTLEGGEMNTAGQLIAVLRKQAGLLGANAIILERVGEKVTDARLVFDRVTVDRKPVVRALAIRR